MNNTYLIVGSNEGERRQNLETAKRQIIDSVGVIIQASSIYETAPWGNFNQEPFYNQVILVATRLEKEILLAKLKQIEKGMGRVQRERYGARIIDIDILFFNEEIYKSPTLTIPHKHIAERNFVLAPMVEIAPDFVHPALKKMMKGLLNECADTLSVKKLSSAKRYSN